MANGIPLPNSEQVFEEIGAVTASLGHYLAESDWNLKRLSKMAEQLRNADEGEGNRALASVWQLTGDKEKALIYSDRAIRLAENPNLAMCGKIAILVNLGYFSEAQSAFKACSVPEQGNMTNAWKRGYLCGAFRTMSSYIPRAKKMQFKKLEGLDTDTAVRAANVMEKAGVSDDDVAKVLDAAGIVLRKRRLFYVGDGLRVQVLDSEDSDALIEISFDVEASPKEAHAIHQEFVDQVLENVPLMPSILTVSFRPWKQNERNAA